MSNNFESSCQDLNRRIAEQERTIEQNEVSAEYAQEALELHLQQLERLGAHLEDSVCCVLRKVIARAEAEAELNSLKTELRSLKVCNELGFNN